MNAVDVNGHNPVPPTVADPSKKKQKKKKKRSKKKAATTEGQGYGTYACQNCKARWGSPSSQAGVAEECEECKTLVLPKIHPPGKKLTPYQGNRRCFGQFKCTQCEKSWSSGYSWADMGQQCKDCLINIYPHMQRPLLRKRGTNNKRHLDEYCEKCKTGGSRCAMAGND